ncbi:MAG: FAD-binding monooxygenase [Alphaproteobacteria bacterium]|nr:FAD-binding monooxygenase [Alphaproteobacteria bacterium]
MIGAGPAGAAAAIALGGACRVVLLERSAGPDDRIGETLPGIARPLLEQLGLWRGFAAGGHAPFRARRWVWGGPDPVEQESASAEGMGWRLDRRAFEGQLRGAVAETGVELIAPAGVTNIHRDSDGWTIELVGRNYDRPLKLRARLVIDAGGRASRMLRPFGQTRLADDRLVCAWIHAPLISEPPDTLYLESEAEGWWYSAPLPDGRRLIAFHTDSDLPVTGHLLEVGLVERAAMSSGLADVIADSDLGHVSPVRFCVAHGARLDSAAGDGWLAVGDAAACFDPLGSYGLLGALDTGLHAAQAARRQLDGDKEAGADYDQEVARLWRLYKEERDARYASELRWPASPFWKRRLPAA